MPEPELSAVLNNCPLHAITPEIKAEVLKFAADSHYNNQHNAHYETLKKDFALFYGFNPESFSWAQFSGILNRYNPFDIQILMGPVLRRFSEHSMRTNADGDLVILAKGNDMESEAYINFTTKINLNNGRYESLSPDHLFKYVAKELGYNLTYHKEGQRSRSFIADNPITTINIHHQGGIAGAQSGGHWERTNKKEDRIKYDQQADAQLVPFLPFLGQDAALNPCGINLLKKHIQLSAKAIAEKNALIDQFTELNYTAQQISQYLNNIVSVPKALAITLLGKPLTEDTTAFITNYAFVEIPKNQIYEVYIKAEPTKKPVLKEREPSVITRLMIQPPHVSPKASVVPKVEPPKAELAQAQVTSPAKSPTVREPAVILDLAAQSARNSRQQKTTKQQPDVVYQAVPKFNVQLALLKGKIEDLTKRRQFANAVGNINKAKDLGVAIKAASDLYSDLDVIKVKYFTSPTPNFNSFKAECKTRIGHAHTQLDQHRGWSEFLTNLALGILTAGLGLLLKGAVNVANDRFFFHVHSTNSAKTIDKLKDSLDEDDPNTSPSP
jgi:hypothetical protein